MPSFDLFKEGYAARNIVAVPKCTDNVWDRQAGKYGLVSLVNCSFVASYGNLFFLAATKKGPGQSLSAEADPTVERLRHFKNRD